MNILGFFDEYTHIAGLKVGFLCTDQKRCISNGSVPVLHLLILFFVLVLREDIMM